MSMESPVIPSVESAPVLSTRVLRPHPVGVTADCVTCHRPRAHWRVQHPRYGAEVVDVCALCFLYESGWLVPERVRRVTQVIQVIGLKRQKPLECAVGTRGDKMWPPRLEHIKDADDVLGAIVLHDRFEVVMNRQERS